VSSLSSAELAASKPRPRAAAPAASAAGLTVYLYDGIGQPWFSVEAVRGYVAEWVPWVRTEVRGDLLAEAVAGIRQQPCRQATLAGLAEKLCQARTVNPAETASPRRRRILKPEMDFERHLLAGSTRAVPGVVYDGLDLQLIAFGMVARTELGPEAIHVWFTERPIATWDDASRRYHARVSLYGLPSIVSASGMVQAPALEREQYLARRLGLWPSEAGAPSGSHRLVYEDPRTTEVAKGYAMQALFYALTGDPFCDDPRCRLFNAHWQLEMLAAQLGGAEFCAAHRERLLAWQAGWSDRVKLC